VCLFTVVAGVGGRGMGGGFMTGPVPGLGTGHAGGKCLGIAPSRVQAHLARAIIALGHGLCSSDSRESIMNGDEELLTAVRELRATVTMTVPVGYIIGRGRAVRASRRILALAAIVAVMAAAVFAMTALLPS
jgi:hypothetical protein